MSEDVIISIKGLHLMDEESDDEVEVYTAGKYFQREGVHYIKYNETMEGTEGIVSNLIKVTPDHMEVTRKGVIDVQMLFEENQKHVTYYRTPFGNLLIGILATDICISQKEDGLDIQVAYDMEINQEHVADCTIQMLIQPKNSSTFHLQ